MTTARCWLCGRRRGPSPDGLGSHCRRKYATTPTAPSAPAAGQLPLEDHMTVTDPIAITARAALIARLGGDICDDMDSACEGCTDARALVDAYRAEVLAEAKTETVGWLEKKAREHRSKGPQYAKQADLVDKLASKADRGAIRSFLHTGPKPMDPVHILGIDTAEPAAETRLCGHDDYHDGHPWHDRPTTWCPGWTD